MALKDVNQRPRYFAGQYLLEDDFESEQDYHIDRQRRHNRLLHVSGIAEGLGVEFKDNKLTVSSGTAVDKHGQQIVLLENQTVQWPSTNEEYILFIQYPDTETKDLQQSGTQDGYRRIVENPSIGFVSVDDTVPDSAIKLAKLTIEQGTIKNNDPSVREYSGLRLPSPDGELSLCFTQKDGTNNLANLQGSLSVSGNVFVTSSLTVTGTTNLNSSVTASSLTVTGTTNLNSSVTASSLTVTGTTNLNSSVTASSLTVTGITNLNSSVTASSLTVTGITNLNSSVTVNGNVGIGTTTPMRKLTIQADYSATSDAQQLLIQGSTNTNYQLLLGYHTTGNYGSIQAIQQDNEVKPLVLNPAGGNVGIGTTSPSEKLEVAGNLKVTGLMTSLTSINFPQSVGQKLNLYGSLYGIGIQNDTQYFRTYQHFAWYKRGSHNDELLNPGGGTVQMVINDGNVGIGTTTPAATLDVQGNVYIGTGQDSKNYKLAIRGPHQPGGQGSFQDISYEFASAGSAKIRAYRGTSWDTYLQFLTNPFNLGKDEPQVSLHINHDGNVGIGTTNPTAKLEVSGNISATNANVNGRILRQGKPFSYSGIAYDQQEVKVSWGTTEDWNIFVAPSYGGIEERGSEFDNAVIAIYCHAEELDDKKGWKVIIQFKVRWWANPDIAPVGGEKGTGVWQSQNSGGKFYANYLLVPR